MTIVANAADGTQHNFPDGTDPSVIDRVMKDYAVGGGAPGVAAKPSPAQQPTQVSSPISVDNSATQQFGGAAERLLSSVREGLVGTHGVFGQDYLKGSAEGLKQMGRTIGQSLLPGRAGAEAGGDIVRGLMEGSAAFVGENMGGAPAGSVIQKGVPTTAAQRLLQDMRTTGITPRVPTVGGGRVAGLAAQAGRMVPGSPVSRGMRQDIGATGAAAERTAGQYGAAETPEEAGSVAQNALQRFAGPERQAQAEADYGEFDRIMHGAPLALVSRTVKTLKDMIGRFPNAPGVAGLLTNPKLSKLAEELSPATKTVPAQTSSVLGPSGAPVVTQAARTVQTGGKLSMPELQELRSQIGRMIEDKTFGPDSIPKAQLKQVYGSLTRDMQEAARARGPAAARALQKATINYGTRMQLIEDLEPIAKAKSPEAAAALINRAARGGNAGILQKAQKAMTPEEWGDVGAATIRGLGKPTAANASAGPFSVTSFSTGYAKISDHAKDIMFGPDVPGSPRAGLEALSRVAGAQANVEKLAGVSHGEHYLLGAAATLVVESAISGRLPWATAAGWAGAYGAGKLLMSPVLARWLYALPNVIKGSPSVEAAYPRALAALQMAEASEGRAAIGGPAPAMAQPQRQAQPQRPTQAPVSARDYLDRRARGEGEGGPVQLPSGVIVPAPAR